MLAVAKIQNGNYGRLKWWSTPHLSSTKHGPVRFQARSSDTSSQKPTARPKPKTEGYLAYVASMKGFKSPETGYGIG